jgi:hypothetical protein
MKPAEQIVEALLGDQDSPEDLVNRQGDMIEKAQVADQVRRIGVKLEEIDGVEIYGMFTDGDCDYRRHNHDDPPPTFWGVSIHTTNQQQWIEDWDDYQTREEAVAAGTKLHAILTMLVDGDQHIHLIDDTNPS